jgi:hypothetical protein
MGSLGLSMGFFFFYLIYRGGRFNRIGKDLFTVTFGTVTFGPRLL